MKKIYLPFVCIFFCLLTHSLFAQKMFLKAGALTLNGAILDPAFREFKDYVEISGVQYSLDAASSYPSGAGPIADPTFGEVVVTKNVDKLSTALLKNISNSTVIPLMEIVSTQLIDGNAEVTYKIELKDVFVSHVSQAGVPGCNTGCGVAESVKLVYKRIRVSTYQVSLKGVVSLLSQFMVDVRTLQPVFD